MLFGPLLSCQMNIPRWNLIFAGDGPTRENLEQLASQLGIADRVTFEAGWNRLDFRVIHQSTVVLVPFRCDESFGLVAAEAAFMNRPVIATNTGALPEVVLKGVTGLVVPPGQIDRLITAISSLLIDPTQARRMGTAARSRAEGLFGMDTFTGAHEILYERIIDDFRRSG